MTTQFETGKSYGNDLTIEILNRTAKTATIKTTFGTQRIKVREYQKGVECISFKCWLITASEDFNKEEASQLAMERAYYN